MNIRDYLFGVNASLCPNCQQWIPIGTFHTCAVPETDFIDFEDLPKYEISKPDPIAPLVAAFARQQDDSRVYLEALLEIKTVCEWEAEWLYNHPGWPTLGLLQDILDVIKRVTLDRIDGGGAE